MNSVNMSMDEVLIAVGSLQLENVALRKQIAALQAQIAELTKPADPAKTPDKQ